MSRKWVRTIYQGQRLRRRENADNEVMLCAENATPAYAGHA